MISQLNKTRAAKIGSALLITGFVFGAGAKSASAINPADAFWAAMGWLYGSACRFSTVNYADCSRCAMDQCLANIDAITDASKAAACIAAGNARCALRNNALEEDPNIDNVSSTEGPFADWANGYNP